MKCYCILDKEIASKAFTGKISEIMNRIHANIQQIATCGPYTGKNYIQIHGEEPADEIAQKFLITLAERNSKRGTILPVLGCVCCENINLMTDHLFVDTFKMFSNRPQIYEVKSSTTDLPYAEFIPRDITFSDTNVTFRGGFLGTFIDSQPYYIVISTAALKTKHVYSTNYYGVQLYVTNSIADIRMTNTLSVVWSWYDRVDIVDCELLEVVKFTYSLYMQYNSTKKYIVSTDIYEELSELDKSRYEPISYLGQVAYCIAKSNKNVSFVDDNAEYMKTILNKISLMEMPAVHKVNQRPLFEI